MEEGVEWKRFPFKDAIFSDMRVEVAEGFAEEVMAKSAGALWENFSVDRVVTAARDLQGLALTEFFAWVEYSEGNVWARLLYSDKRGEIMLHAFRNLMAQAEMDYPERGDVKGALKEAYAHLETAVRVAVDMEGREPEGAPDPDAMVD